VFQTKTEAVHWIMAYVKTHVFIIGEGSPRATGFEGSHDKLTQRPVREGCSPGPPRAPLAVPGLRSLLLPLTCPARSA